MVNTYLPKFHWTENIWSCKLEFCNGLCELMHEKTYLLTCAPNEDSDEPAHPRSLIIVFVVRVVLRCILGYPKCAQWRFWSDCVNVQADLNLLWEAHIRRYVLTLRPIYWRKWYSCLKLWQTVFIIFFVCLTWIIFTLSSIYFCDKD